MESNIKKVYIEFHDHQIPVYWKEERRGVIDMLVKVLERKLEGGRELVQRFLNNLDSIEIEGSEAILYSTRERGTLALSLY